ncbi:MAG TPA: FAD-binding oxidoreductase [Gaiellaceae bacterium]|nr:FAD-binding oxidoreductase [Gaiellaceae bacterium]
MPSVFEAEPLAIAQAAEMLGQASREGRRVSIERAGGELVVSTRYLNRLLEHEAGDLTVTVEAGIRLSALNERLAEHGQMLALDPPGDPTVGAAIAGDLFGPRAYRYGRVRDLVLGVTVVLADGTIANAGGKVVKNVAGYDLAKLFCGSHGRLGLIARASLRLHPRPEASRTLVVPVSTPDDVRTLVSTLIHSPLAPSAVDLVWSEEQSVLATLLEGRTATTSDQLERARALLGGQEDDDVWNEVAASQLGSRSRGAFPAGELAAALAELPEALIRIGPTCFAYLPQPYEQPWSALAERVRAQFDPAGTLA